MFILGRHVFSIRPSGVGLFPAAGAGKAGAVVGFGMGGDGDCAVKRRDAVGQGLAVVRGMAFARASTSVKTRVNRALPSGVMQ